MAVDFIEEPFTVAIRRGNAILTWPSGRKMAMPLEVFRAGHLLATEALAQYDAERGAIIPLRGRGKA